MSVDPATVENMSTQTDHITIPALYIGMPDARLEVEPDAYGDSYTMTLRADDGRVIASASGFRPGACRDFSTDLEHAAHTAGTFGSFLAAACENRRYGDGEFASEWDELADDADEWADALTVMSMDDA